MPIKISKAVKDLNIRMQTARDFLKKNEIEVDDNINARISDEAYNLLIQKFKPAMQQKKAAEQIIHDRKEEKAAQAAEKKRREAEESKTVEVAIQKPKVLGKIELDAKGNPVAPKPAAPEAPKAEEVKMEEKKAEEQKPAPAELPKEEAKPEPAAIEPKKEEKAPAEPKVEKPQPVAEAPVVEQKKEEAPAPAPQAEPETISNAPRMQGPKVVGKIDLSALNQSTRPKKKTKEEKRNERINKEKARQGANADGEKRKRKRIGKEKVDIEKSVQQQSQGGGNQKRGNQQNAANAQNANAGKRNKKDKNKRPFKAEVSEEDVQRQMKETLARLTNKPQKKGAKWRREKREAFREEERAEAAEAAAESKILKLTEFVTANDLAAMMNVPINKVIGTCMSIGVMVSINQRLDAETINIVAEEFGYKTEYESADVAEQIHEEEDNPEDLESRPPVVTVMGHVDHGKTSLLDHIRNANVIAGEAGGITQHIGAYNVKLKNGRRITFLDTPGHEAFTAMRARGAKVTDIVIIIVAADDAVMPQTVEALNHASAAGVPIIFAINKIDKPGANPDKIKEELANLNYLVEEWGGKYQSQDISAKKGIGVAELLDKVLLEADMLELKANPHRKATGSIIESSLDKGRGYVATLLVDNGTLHVGDIILAGTHYGKVKAMFNERNQRIQEAGPSSPALILGLNGAPTAGDKFNVMDTDQEARQIANKREQLQRELGLRTQKRFTLEDIARRKALGEFHELNVIVKGDVDGSIEALSDSLLKLSTPEVQVNVVHKAVGAISESDVTLAAASNAYIIGFQVRPSADAKRLAAQEGVDIRIYSIIYDAIEEVKSAMEGMLAPDIKEEVIGNVMVKEVYHISKVGTIAGAMVMDGKIKRNCKVRVIRDGIVRYTGALASLKRFKDDVKEVTNGFECGLSIAGYNDILPDDMLEAFEEVEVQKSL
ncbi:MAG: translation initiation factor IF-2 [Porphyromonadaceae bacterium]|nr:MAG: translation initiation factor IF-2 [Porphyromonadaceae bacterium]